MFKRAGKSCCIPRAIHHCALTAEAYNPYAKQSVRGEPAPMAERPMLVKLVQCCCKARIKIIDARLILSLIRPCCSIGVCGFLLG
jgi:hypothetical protein